MEKSDFSTVSLIFVYHAESGLFNALTDAAHKLFSPQTYQCHLCALTYSTFKMRYSWRRFLETLHYPFEFLHADELKTRYGISDTLLPAIFKKENQIVEIWIDAHSINNCRTLGDLQQLIRERLHQLPSPHTR